MVPREASTALTSAAGAELQVLHLENHPRGYSLPAAGGPVALTSLITTEVLCCNTALPKGKRQMQLELGVANVMNTAFASLHFAWKLKACSSPLSSSDYPSTTRDMEKSCLQARGVWLQQDAASTLAMFSSSPYRGLGSVEQVSGGDPCPLQPEALGWEKIRMM